MNATDVRELNGRVVLVCSARDMRNPPTGRRGTLVVRDDPESGIPEVTVEVEFPQMFTTRAHVRRARLNEQQIAELLASDYRGAFTVTLDDWLDPEAAPGNE